MSLVLPLLEQKKNLSFSSNSNNSLVPRACVVVFKANSNPKSNLVINHWKTYILPVFVKLAIPIFVSDFCVSPTLSNSTDAIVHKLSFASYSFKSSFFH